MGMKSLYLRLTSFTRDTCRKSGQREKFWQGDNVARNFNELRAKMSTERRNRVEQRVNEALAAMPLDELREARDLTQTQLAQVLHVSQGAVSKVERRTDMYISTLRSYVRAIGGDLQIRAVFPEGEILIDQFEDIGKN
jgi:DNA-binding transcriptional regulator YiaG